MELLIGKPIKAFSFQLRVPFPNDSSVCGVNKKLSRTIPRQHYTNMTLLNNNLLFFLHLKDLILIPQYELSITLKAPQSLKLQML